MEDTHLVSVGATARSSFDVSLNLHKLLLVYRVENVKTVRDSIVQCALLPGPALTSVLTFIDSPYCWID